MNLSPWNYWDAAGQPTTYTNEIVTTLESVMQRDPNHPGANHYYIHTVEASSQPERAVPSAERLARLVPGCWPPRAYASAYLLAGGTLP